MTSGSDVKQETAELEENAQEHEYIRCSFCGREYQWVTDQTKTKAAGFVDCCNDDCENSIYFAE